MGGPDEVWQNASLVTEGSGGPPAGPGGAMVYDAYDGYAVFVGSGGSPRGVSQTWTFQDGLWTNRTGELFVSPPAEVGAAIGYDANSQVVLLYGGCGVSACPSNSTWYYTGASGWIDITSSLSPSSPSLWGSSLAFAADAADGYPLLFGGCRDSACHNVSNATLAFDGFGWIALPTAHAPPALYDAGLSYDDAIGALVLFGGCSAAGCASNGSWTYSNYDWTNATAAFDAAGPGMPGRSSFALTWDELDGTLLAFGGTDGNRVFNDTWELACSVAGCNWTNVTLTAGYVLPVAGMAVPSTANASVGTLFFGGVTSAPGAGSRANVSNRSDTFVFEPVLKASFQVPGPLPSRALVPVRAIPSGGSGAYPRFAGQYWADWSYNTQVTTGLAANLTFYPPGDYKVTAIVYDRFGVSVGWTFPYEATGPSSGIIGWSTAWTGAAANFSAIPASGGNGPYTYDWTFGDGGAGTGLNTTHTWSSAGVFEVDLTVIDSTSVRFTTRMPVNVDLVYLSINANRTMTDVGIPLTFSYTFVGPPDPLTCDWNFGDGSPPSAEPSPTNVYSAPGNYTIDLVVANQSGTQSEANLVVTVNPPLSGTAAATPSHGTVGAMIGFGIAPQGGTSPYSIAWNFGDGTVASGADVQHRFIDTGNHSVVVTVNDSGGGILVASLVVDITPAPVPVSSSGFWGGFPWLPTIVTIAVAIVVASVGLVIRRRRYPPPPTKSDGSRAQGPPNRGLPPTPKTAPRGTQP